MEAVCLRQTDLPHTSRLFADFSYHFDRLANFYSHNPHTPSSYADAAAQIQFPDERRAQLVEMLRSINGDHPALERLARPGTVAVVTGQQVGLFSGPAYTIYKALTAAKLAVRLTEQGIPAVPVFWLATEDHDFEEVNHVWSFNGQFAPQKFVAPLAQNGSHAVGGIVPQSYPVDELRASIAEMPFGAEVASLVEESYRPGVSMGVAFRKLLESLLHRFGILFVDPLAPALRQMAAPFLKRALEAAPTLKSHLLRRNIELKSQGYHAQVLIEQDTSLFFLLENGERKSIKRKDAEFAGIADRAADISPNAVLRPVLQDYLFPTVAYIGGPAEVAYLAQSKVIYDELLGRMPVVLPRSGFTLLDPRAQKLLSRYRLPLTQVFDRQDVVKERIAERLVPSELARRFDETAHAADQALHALDKELGEFDPTLSAALEKSRSKISYQLTKLRHKTERETLRRDARAQEESAYLSNMLYPTGHLQERLYTILPFLARHGFDLMDDLYERVALECPDHQVLTI
jgi:bacillithiol biosynthesis cysteine-adding enzyme BshC